MQAFLIMLRFHQMSDPASSVVRSSWNLEERFVAHVSAIWTMRSDLEFRTVIREKEEKIEKRRFFSSCPDFINGPILLCPWSDRAEIRRRGSQLINLQFERWRSDLEFWRVIFQPKIEPLFWRAFLSGLFWSLALIEVNSWSDWVAILGAHSGHIDLHSNSRDWIWSLEKWYFSPRIVVMFGEISPLLWI